MISNISIGLFNPLVELTSTTTPGQRGSESNGNEKGTLLSRELEPLHLLLFSVIRRTFFTGEGRYSQRILNPEYWAKVMKSYLLIKYFDIQIY